MYIIAVNKMQINLFLSRFKKSRKEDLSNPKVRRLQYKQNVFL